MPHDIHTLCGKELIASVSPAPLKDATMDIQISCQAECVPKHSVKVTYHCFLIEPTYECKRSELETIYIPGTHF